MVGGERNQNSKTRIRSATADVSATRLEEGWGTYQKGLEYRGTRPQGGERKLESGHLLPEGREERGGPSFLSERFEGSRGSGVSFHMLNCNGRQSEHIDRPLEADSAGRRTRLFGGGRETIGGTDIVA